MISRIWQSIIKFFRSKSDSLRGDLQGANNTKPEYHSPHEETEEKVFLSYAEEDEKIALKLYNDLTDAGISVWIDKEDILPGEKWREKIIQAIKKSSYFLALFSSRSYSKRGFVRKQLTIALDLLDEYPQDKIFIIPIRIDNFELTEEKLLELKWVNLFPSYKRGLNSILHVLSVQKLKSEALLDYSDADDNEPHDLLSELSEWKQIHNESQLLVNALNTPLNLIAEYRSTKDTVWLEKAGYAWQFSCVPKLKLIKNEWKYQKARTSIIDDLKEQTSSEFLDEISRQLMQYSQDAEVKFLLLDLNGLYGNLWTLLSVADKNIMILIPKLRDLLTY